MIDTVKEASGTETEQQPGAMILDGRALAAKLREDARVAVEDLKSRHKLLPGLAILLVGENPASLGYMRMILKTCAAVGLPAQVVELPERSTRGMIQSEIERLNVLQEVAGVIVQMPLPAPHGPDVVTEVLDPRKDVDGIHPENAGRLALGYTAMSHFQPATPLAGMELLRANGIAVGGKNVLIIGRSGVVGRPLALMMLAANATISVAHSRTPAADLARLLSQADIVASAVGKPGLVRGEQLKPGAVVLDFGVSVVDGKMHGDVDFGSASRVASAITPVPGGIGPVTNLMLLQNTLKAVRRTLRQ